MILYLLNGLMGKGAVHEVVDCLITALEARDIYSSGHSTRVADMAKDMAKYLGVRGGLLEDIHLAAHLHDIGKLSIHQSILQKKEKLLPHEWAQIQMYPEIGYGILKKSKGLSRVAEIVLYHREHWDGKGYPNGIAGDKIPLGSRIISAADALEAMTSERPYRKATTLEGAVEEVQLNKGMQFDPVVAEAVQKLWKKWKKQWK